MSPWRRARHQTSTGWNADRTLAVSIRESHAVSRELIESRSLNPCVAGASQPICRPVINTDKQDMLSGFHVLRCRRHRGSLSLRTLKGERQLETVWPSTALNPEQATRDGACISSGRLKKKQGRQVKLAGPARFKRSVPEGELSRRKREAGDYSASVGHGTRFSSVPSSETSSSLVENSRSFWVMRVER